MNIYLRKEWKAREPRAMTLQAPPLEAFLHHSSGENGKQFNTFQKQAAHVRSIQNYHMDGADHGWSDIGYAFMVFQYVGIKDLRNEPRIFQCRLTKYVPAAQLGHNSRTLPICVVGNGDVETLEYETRKMIAQLVRMFPSVKILRPHDSVTATDCPGDRFKRAIPDIAKLAKVKSSM